MNPRDLLEVADDLLGGLKEAYWRSAVSRAYYAAFHEARQLLWQCQFTVPKGEQAHAYLWLRLSNCGHPDLAHAGAELNDLRSQRNWADYDFDQVLDQNTAADYVQSAHDIVHLLELAATMADLLSQVTAAMQVYERDVLGEVTWQS
jgi:uncharacterized protein (UPF0332 family)